MDPIHERPALFTRRKIAAASQGRPAAHTLAAKSEYKPTPRDSQVFSEEKREDLADQPQPPALWQAATE